MLAGTFQEPGRVDVEERPEPEPREATDAVVRIHATGVCGSDLHIYHGRHPVEPGFTLGHEFVGEVLATGDDVTGVAPGDRVIGCFLAACGRCWFCQRRLYHLCDSLRIFGHGEISGGLQGSQAEQVLVPNADLVLRRAPETLGDDAALFAGDVMNTGFHAIRSAGLQEGQSAAVLGLGPVDLCVEAVGHEQALDLAVRLTRKAGTVSTVGVHGERCQVHMGLLWNKGLVLKAGVANVIANVDEVLGMLSSGALDPLPLVTHHMKLEDAPEAYAIYDRREALKIVL